MPAGWRRLARAEARLAGEAAAVAGVDEAGRGPLAGPVVAAAVVLDRDVRWDGVADSKLLEPDERGEIFARVLSRARAFGWSVLGARAIDRLNIRGASLDRAKAERLRRAARSVGAGARALRIDVIALEPVDDGLVLRHYRNAITD